MNSKKLLSETARKNIKIFGTEQCQTCLKALEIAENEIELLNEKLQLAQLNLENLENQINGK